MEDTQESPSPLTSIAVLDSESASQTQEETHNRNRLLDEVTKKGYQLIQEGGFTMEYLHKSGDEITSCARLKNGNKRFKIYFAATNSKDEDTQQETLQALTFHIDNETPNAETEGEKIDQLTINKVAYPGRNGEPRDEDQPVLGSFDGFFTSEDHIKRNQTTAAEQIDFLKDILNSEVDEEGTRLIFENEQRIMQEDLARSFMASINGTIYWNKDSEKSQVVFRSKN